MAKKKKKKSSKKIVGKFNTKGLSGMSKGMRQKILGGRFNAIYDLNKMLSEEHEERIVNNAGTVQKFGDFKYQDGGTVPVGESYHIHYSRIGKSEIYMTGNKHDETSLVIDRVKGNTDFGQYVNLKGPTKAADYLNKHRFKVTKKHQKIGHARRYFAKQGNNLESSIFEISKVDYSKETPFYEKTQLKWSLNLDRELMKSKNVDEIERAASQGFTSLEFSLNPEEGYLGGDKTSKEETLNRINKLLPKENVFKLGGRKKKRKKKKSSKSKPTTTSATSPSSQTTTRTTSSTGRPGY